MLLLWPPASLITPKGELQLARRLRSVHGVQRCPIATPRVCVHLSTSYLRIESKLCKDDIKAVATKTCTKMMNRYYTFLITLTASYLLADPCLFRRSRSCLSAPISCSNAQQHRVLRLCAALKIAACFTSILAPSRELARKCVSDAADDCYMPTSKRLLSLSGTCSGRSSFRLILGRRSRLS